MSSEVDEEVSKLSKNFPDLSKQFDIQEKVGEGTFSFVYKGIDKWSNPPQVVAVKSIHATSSPTRIHNELQILVSLQDSELVCSIITALRHRDQVVLVMPYFEFTDFREFYMHFDAYDIKDYMQQLLSALRFIASRGVIHRDVKPTNFLYNNVTKRGVLVDFGLAEYYRGNGNCACGVENAIDGNTPSPEQADDPAHEDCAKDATLNQYAPQKGYLREDTRPQRRANRAGTRGFRAPEILFKCDRQNSKIDVWAAGVIMLMMICKRFPFFNSMDDGDAIVEMATIFGSREMRNTALIHGSMFETNIPTIPENRHAWTDFVDWSLGRENLGDRRLEQDCLALELLNKLMELDVRKRPTAGQALKHEFFSI